MFEPMVTDYRGNLFIDRRGEIVPNLGTPRPFDIRLIADMGIKDPLKLRAGQNVMLGRHNLLVVNNASFITYTIMLGKPTLDNYRLAVMSLLARLGWYCFACAIRYQDTGLFARYIDRCKSMLT